MSIWSFIRQLACRHKWRKIHVAHLMEDPKGNRSDVPWTHTHKRCIVCRKLITVSEKKK